MFVFLFSALNAFSAVTDTFESNSVCPSFTALLIIVSVTETGCFPRKHSSILQCGYNSSRADSPCYYTACVLDFTSTACVDFVEAYCVSLNESAVESDPGCFRTIRSTCPYLHDPVSGGALLSPCHRAECVSSVAALSSLACQLYSREYCRAVGVVADPFCFPNPEGSTTSCPFNASDANSPCLHPSCVRGLASSHEFSAPLFARFLRFNVTNFFTDAKMRLAFHGKQGMLRQVNGLRWSILPPPYYTCHFCLFCCHFCLCWSPVSSVFALSYPRGYCAVLQGGL